MPTARGDITSFLAHIEEKGLVHPKKAKRHADPVGDAIYAEVWIETRTLSNLRLHWAVKSRIAKDQRTAVEKAMEPFKDQMAKLAEGCTIKLTRISPRPLDRHNLMEALKHVVDQLGQMLWGGRVGQKDDDDRGSWEFAQLNGKGMRKGVSISIRPRTT